MVLYRWWMTRLDLYNQITNVWTFAKDPTLMKHLTKVMVEGTGGRAFQVWAHFRLAESLYSLLGSSSRTRLCHLSLSKCSLFTGFRPHTSGRRFLGKNSGHAKTASVFCLPYLRSFVYIISGGWFRNSFMRLKCLAWKSIFLPFCLASTLRLCHLVAHWWIRLVIQYSIKILK